ncbi:hypothetical protein [Psychrobium sp. 1_MG-2023]|uniref:hypothetical protein n=1 Tax=Psychrobium sp. 1_MG-2023 TaxID=3062624 RepID=UPI0026A5A152|nr:hypothetical protein [Psychrobium sp. 1_MG-2023]MDP2561387.1 hypothetical protein [Psychrobium sp. 1_MG-2023]
MKRFPKAQQHIQILQSKEINLNKIGHFGLFKPENKAVWRALIVSRLDKYNQN